MKNLTIAAIAAAALIVGAPVIAQQITPGNPPAETSPGYMTRAVRAVTAGVPA